MRPATLDYQRRLEQLRTEAEEIEARRARGDYDELLDRREGNGFSQSSFS